MEEALARRATRHARARRYRKAAVALSMLANRTGEPRHYARLGAMWLVAGRSIEAILAFRQALYRHRRAGADARARTVARIIARVEPGHTRAAA